MQSKNDPSRRHFLKTVLFSAVAVFAAPMARVQQVFAEAVKATDPLVKALGYVPNAKDSKDRKDKKAVCGGCQFYLSPGKPTSKCQLIPTGEVSADGWCKSWAKRAEAAKPAKKS